MYYETTDEYVAMELEPLTASYLNRDALVALLADDVCGLRRAELLLIDWTIRWSIFHGADHEKLQNLLVTQSNLRTMDGSSLINYAIAQHHEQKLDLSPRTLGRKFE